jgi:hypothetical protein
MATLFERIVGVGTTSSLYETKIALHAFAGGIDEQGAGYVTGPELVTMFELDAGQSADLQTMVQMLNAAGSKTAYMRTYKDILYMGEWNLAPRYRDEVWFWNRLASAVTDTGGTWP